MPLTPALRNRSSAVRCGAEPAPGEPKVTPLGSAFAYLMNSASDLYGASALTTRNSGAMAVLAMEVKLLCTSYGKSL